MLKKITFLLLFFVLGPGAAVADVVDFDDLGGLLTDGRYYQPFDESGFQSDGFQFDMFLMSQDVYSNSHQNSSSYPSPEIAAYINDNSESDNPYGQVTISTLDGSLFNFLGASFGGFTTWDSIAYFAATELTIEGFVAGELVDTVVFSPLNIGFQYVAVDIAGIDTLVFNASAGDFDYSGNGYSGVVGDGTYWMMDDFEFGRVPEPGIHFLFACGILMLILMVRRTGFSVK